jgi:hypothetical protein
MGFSGGAKNFPGVSRRHRWAHRPESSQSFYKNNGVRIKIANHVSNVLHNVSDPADFPRA